MLFLKHLRYVWEQRENPRCHEVRVETLQGASGGPAVMCIGGVHGNEPAGAHMLESALQELKISRGVLIATPSMRRPIGYSLYL